MVLLYYYFYGVSMFILPDQAYARHKNASYLFQIHEYSLITHEQQSEAVAVLIEQVSAAASLKYDSGFKPSYWLFQVIRLNFNFCRGEQNPDVFLLTQ